MHKKLKTLREKAEFTQEHLATMLDTTSQYVSGVENGRTKISLNQAVKWAEACGHDLKVVFVEKTEY